MRKSSLWINPRQFLDQDSLCNKEELNYLPHEELVDLLLNCRKIYKERIFNLTLQITHVLEEQTNRQNKAKVVPDLFLHDVSTKPDSEQKNNSKREFPFKAKPEPGSPTIFSPHNESEPEKCDSEDEDSIPYFDDFKLYLNTHFVSQAKSQSPKVPPILEESLWHESFEEQSSEQDDLAQFKAMIKQEFEKLSSRERKKSSFSKCFKSDSDSEGSSSEIDESKMKRIGKSNSDEEVIVPQESESKKVNNAVVSNVTASSKEFSIALDKEYRRFQKQRAKKQHERRRNLSKRSLRGSRS